MAKLRKDLKREYQKPSIKSLKSKGKKTKRGKKEGPSFELVLGDNDKQQENEEEQKEEEAEE